MTFSKRHNCGNSEKISAFGSLGRGGAQMEHGGCGGSETALRLGGPCHCTFVQSHRRCSAKSDPDVGHGLWLVTLPRQWQTLLTGGTRGREGACSD